MNSNIILLVVSVLAAALLLHPHLLRSRKWRATVTPLASIIGSGFLVAGPILVDTFGSYAWLSMLALCGAGYFYGAAIRHNIAFVEPCLDTLPATATAIERASNVMLAVCYFVSIAYYLNLFAAFGLRIFSIEERLMIRIVASVAISALGAIGLLGGLKSLEKVEIVAVGLKLSIICGLLATLMFFASTTPDIQHVTKAHRGFDQIQILLGLVILVQGFETSRYLGAEYGTDMRIRTMQYAQWLSTAIYAGFILLVAHLFHGNAPHPGSETAIINMLRPMGAAAAAPLLIMAALASQSSAAVADMNGASGLLAEATKNRLSVNMAYLTAALVAIGITWSGDIYEIIVYASKAFVGYYALQSLQAALSSFRRKKILAGVGFSVGILLATAVIVLGKPASA